MTSESAAGNSELGTSLGPLIECDVICEPTALAAGLEVCRVFSPRPDSQLKPRPDASAFGSQLKTRVLPGSLPHDPIISPHV